MRLSFFCPHCKKHLRSGDHTECKKILRAANPKQTPLKGNEKYIDETSGKYLADRNRFA